MKAVTVREGVLELPSYQPGRPDPEPPLLPGFGQNHLPIYPYPTIEWFEERPSPRRLRTVELENEYLLLVFTPELNGRLYRLYDKLAGAEVLYANAELKPGLVGLRGVWYATGIEVNFPSSHNVTTAEEIACRVLLGDDGSASVVAWDIEATSGMAWECTTTLTPGAAAVTMQTRLANPTDLPHRYYFWVNAAFPIHPGSRYIFPPSTRRIFTEAGLHPGELGYLDYPIHRGCDISRFENLRHASSHFGMTPDEGFFGLHHEHQDTGVAHVADPHLVPGRKIWSWGFAADGQLWHEALSDSSGPYCEVQSGPFRSQIEYRALGPGQELLQREHWLPLRGLGGLSFANESFAAAWTAESGTLGLRLLAARSLPRAVLVVDGREHRLDLSPDDAVLLELPAPEQSRLRLLDAHRNLVGQFDLTPPPARTAPRLRSAGEVTPAQRGRFCEWAGQRRAAEEAYRAGAEEEVEAAAALARFALERDDAAGAQRWARRAMALDWHHPAALLTSALAARAVASPEELWYWEEMLGHQASRAQGILGLIDHALTHDELLIALERTNQLIAEGGDLRVYGRLAHALRRLGDTTAVADFGEAAPLRTDPLLAAELALADPEAPSLGRTAQLAATELLLRFGDPAGALRVLELDPGPSPGTPTAMVGYAREFITGAWEPPPEASEVGFAAGAFAIRLLREAAAGEGGDPPTHYQLGCALAAAGDWEAAANHWAVATDGPQAAEANRNLGVMAWQIQGDLEAAAAFYRHAVACGAGARTLVEQDRLLAALERHQERLGILTAAVEQHPWDSRLTQRLAAARLDAGQPAEAIELLSAGGFQLYELGTLPQQLWRRAHRALAAQAEASGQPAEAARHFREAARYPRFLGVGEPGDNQVAELWFRAGEAHTAAGLPDEARADFERGGAPGHERLAHHEPYRERIPEGSGRGVNHHRARNEVFQALCLQRLGEAAAAATRLAPLERLAAEVDDAALDELLDAARAGKAP